MISFQPCRSDSPTPAACWSEELVMQRLRHILRTCLVLVMIPLTMFSGRATAGCVCGDGHFEPLCRGGACCASSSNGSQRGPCGCAKCCCSSKKAAQTSAKLSCCGAQQPTSSFFRLNGEATQSCCHPLTLLPMMAEEVITSGVDTELAALQHTVSVSEFPPVVEQPVRVYVVNSGPPRVRLVLLQRFLL